MLDPAVNFLYQKMKNELKETKEKFESAQSELAAWKFTPDSQTGKKLMSRCRTLIQVFHDCNRLPILLTSQQNSLKKLGRDFYF